MFDVHFLNINSVNKLNNGPSHNTPRFNDAAQLEACDIPQDRYRVFIQDVADSYNFV